MHQSVVAPPFLSFYVGLVAPGTLADPFASNPVVTPGSTLAPFITPYQLTFVEPNWRVPYAQQWNLTIERQLPADFLIQLAYVGTTGRNLPGAKNRNRPIHIPGVDPVTGLPFSPRATPSLGVLSRTTAFFFNSPLNSTQATTAFS